VVQARHSIERTDVAILVLDASEGMRDMDATIGGYILDAHRSVVLAVNKWDLAGGLDQRRYADEVRYRLKFLTFAPIVFVSAKTGLGFRGLLRAADRARASWRSRVTTGELNRVLARATQAQTPRATSGRRPVKLLYGAQIGVAPPTFSLAVSQPVDFHFSYRRYLENQLREAFGFEGSPLVLRVKPRRH